MSYFSSNRSLNKTILYHDKLPDGTTKFIYPGKYPESVIIEEENSQPVAHTSMPPCQSKSKPIASNFILFQDAIIILMLFLIAIYITNPKSPPYIEDIYLTAYNFLLPKYQQVYATPHNDTNIAHDVIVSRETNSEAIEEEYTTMQEKSHVQSAILKLSEDEMKENQSISVLNRTDKNIIAVDKNSSSASNGIIGKDLSVGSDKIYSTNETSLTPNLNALAVAAYPLEAVAESNEAAQVLIVHTHGTECYSDSRSGGVRSNDRSENVVRVGKELSDILNYYGITTIHSESMHDEISYLKAYNNSRSEVERILKIHPTIKYVIDLHRDSIPNEGNNRVKPIANIAGEDVAQIMLVVGTNAAGANHPKYEENLTVASHLQSTLNELYPSLARPINIRSAAFNQGFGAGCILLEVGSDANTLDEALKAVRLFGTGFAKVVSKG